MVVLGIETSCDETGVAVYDTARGLLGHVVYSQVDLHHEYGGVVPELASRDHIRRVLPLGRQALARSGLRLAEVNAIAYTEGPGLAGALLVGASVGAALGRALGIPAIGVHHLEGHLLSPLLADPPPEFPFVALLVSGGHTQLMEVAGIGAARAGSGRAIECCQAYGQATRTAQPGMAHLPDANVPVGHLDPLVRRGHRDATGRLPRLRETCLNVAPEPATPGGRKFDVTGRNSKRYRQNLRSGLRSGGLADRDIGHARSI